MGVPVRRSHFATSDPLEAGDFIDRTFGARMRLGAGDPRACRFSYSDLATDDVAVGELRLPADLAFRVEGRPRFVVTSLIAGRVDVGDERYGPGDIYLSAHPTAAFSCRTRGIHARRHAVSAALLEEALDTDAGHGGLRGHRPVHGGAGRWRAATRFVGDLLAEPGVMDAPLVIGAAERVLAATLATSFPLGGDPDPSPADRHDAHPDTVRRAVAFIEENPTADITIGDVARAAHVSARAVQLAFRRHLDTAPMAYLRQVRLDHARRQLLGAEPGDRTTVTSVAYQWGFANPSRFSQHYRAVYGEAPSATLRR